MGSTATEEALGATPMKPWDQVLIPSDSEPHLGANVPQGATVRLAGTLRHHSRDWKGPGLETAGSKIPSPRPWELRHPNLFILPPNLILIFFILLGGFCPSPWPPFWLDLSILNTAFLLFKNIYFSFH